jgi:pyridoxine 5-phosphate synthase
MIRLAVRLDPLIALRGAEPPAPPEPAVLASEAAFGGADRVVVTLTAEREPVRDRDLRILRETAPCGLEVELVPDEALVDAALEARPDQVVLRGPGEGGHFEKPGADPALVEAVDAFQTAGIRTAVIVPPDVPAVLAAQEAGLPFVRIDTGRYGRADTEDREVVAYRAVRECARNAAEIGLRVQAGGALDARTIERIAEVPEVEHIVVGRALAARAVFCGLQTAVREMKQRLGTVRVEGEA